MELEVLWARRLRHGRHGDGLVWGAEGRVDIVVGREIGLAGGHEVEVLLLVGVELEVVRHGRRIRVEINHDADADSGRPGGLRNMK